MWGKDSMTIMQSLQISAMGLMIVFVTLVSLAIFIVVVSKVFAMLEKNITNKQGNMANTNSNQVNLKEKTGENDLDEEAYAVLISVISEEMKLPMDKFVITEIKCVD